MSRPDPGRRRLVLLLVPIGVVAAMSTAANALVPVLATKHPLLMLVLDSRNRYLVLARHVSLGAFILIGTLRRLVSDPLFFLLGRFYGDGAVRWIERRAGGGRYVRIVERLFRRAAYPMVFLFPGALVCALAGETGMGPVAFGVLNVAGTVAIVLVIRGFGDVLGGPVDAVLRFFDHHLALTTSVTIGAAAGWLLLQRLRGSAEDQTIDEIELELEGAAGDGSEAEDGVEPDGEAGSVGDGADGEQDAGHE